MRFRPKRLGNTYSLDDYNATVYLLTFDEWSDKDIELSEIPTQGDFAKYHFDDPFGLLEYNMGSYWINGDIDDGVDYIRLFVEKPVVPEASYTVSFKYRAPEVLKTEDGYTVVAGYDIDDYDNDTLLKIEQQQQKELEKNKTLSITGTFKGDVYHVHLPKTLRRGTMIEPTIDIKVDIHPQPEIDPWNGQANEPDEILVYPTQTEINGELIWTWSELEKMVKSTPRNGKRHIYRLVNNGKVIYPTSEIIIERNQNIEIRGGTNVKSILDGTYSGRIFNVRAGGRLTILNLQLQNCKNIDKTNTSMFSTERGLGGAISVDYSKTFGDYLDWGCLKVSRCRFQDCQAYKGGAIFSYHARLIVKDSEFIRCRSRVDHGGGAIYYDNVREIDYS